MSNLITFILHVLWFSILSECFVSKADGLACICSPCDKHLNNTCEVDPKGKCFTLKYEQEDGHPHFIFGCATQENNVPQLANLIVSALHSRAINYCDDEDFCNDNLQPLLHITSHSSTDYKFLIGCLFGSLSVFLVVLSYSSLYQFRLHSARDPNDIMEVNFDGYPPTKNQYFKDSPHLVELVSDGKMTEVWKAIYDSDYVAVKMKKTDGTAYSWEKDVYQDIAHENILEFIGGNETILMGEGRILDTLVTTYHANGDLNTYLRTHVLDTPTMINMAFDISRGLKYLHFNLYTKHLKCYPKVHTYLESRNILVKDDLTCCIGDFSSADAHRSFMRERRDKVRYLAPEVLKGEEITDMRTDLYSVSLVFWEMARRCNACGIPEEYQLPYFEDVSSNPSKEEMIDVVCTRGIRPSIEPRWLTNKVLIEFVRVMTSNWQMKPGKRMTSACIKKKFARMRLIMRKSSWLSIFQ